MAEEVVRRVKWDAVAGGVTTLAVVVEDRTAVVTVVVVEAGGTIPAAGAGVTEGAEVKVDTRRSWNL